jgi:serine/threonine protein phosphatase 1
MATYIIPDIHGCLKTLKYLLEEKLAITVSDRIYMLGDYIDRGPNSSGVVEYIIQLIESGFNINCIKGNHEQMLLDSISNSINYNLWMMNGGESTLINYSEMTGLGYDKGSYPCIPEHHMNFFKSLPVYIIVDDKYVMVHGGLDFRLKDPFSDEESMLWKRPEPIPDSLVPGKKVFHSHTPYSLEYILIQLSNPEIRLIGLDAGCVFKGKWEGLGYLTSFDLENWKLVWVDNME